MKPLRRLIVPITVALLCVGCGSALQRRLTVGELTAFRRYGWTGMDLTLRVENRSRRALRLSDACLTLYYAGGELGRIELRGEAFVAPRGDSERRRSSPWCSPAEFAAAPAAAIFRFR